MLAINKISKIGIGTWGIGGLAEHDLKNDDDKQINALAYSFDQGINFIEVNNWYAQGYLMELIKKAINKSKLNREDIFIVYSIYGYDLNKINDFNKEVQKFLDIFETDYIDALEILQFDFKKFDTNKVFNLLIKNLDNKITRYVSIANASLNFIEHCYSVFGGKLFSNETHYSFEIRESKKGSYEKPSNPNHKF